MSKFKQEFDDVRQAVKDKVAEAVKLLQEAEQLSVKSGLGMPNNFDHFTDLYNIVGEFIDMPAWDDSGCSF
jgi:hypothetical protein